jgi:hypothetical protein
MAEMMIPTKRDCSTITESVMKIIKYHAAIHPRGRRRGGGERGKTGEERDKEHTEPERGLTHGVDFFPVGVEAVLVAPVHVLERDVAPVVQSADLEERVHGSVQSPEIELVVALEDEDPRHGEVEEHEEHHAHHIEQRAGRRLDREHNDLEVCDPREQGQQAKQIDDPGTL